MPPSSTITEISSLIGITVDTGTSLVALGALFAAHRLVERDTGVQLGPGEALSQQRIVRQIHRPLAVVAQAARRALGDDQGHGAGDVERAIPMFIKRAMVCGPSLVCSVDSTM